MNKDWNGLFVNGGMVSGLAQNGNVIYEHVPTGLVLKYTTIDNSNNQVQSFDTYEDLSNFISLNRTNFKYITLSNLGVEESITSLKELFSRCSKLVSLDLSNFDTSNVTNMDHMFYNCRALINVDLSNFNTSNVTNMEYMFYCCEKLTSLDLSNFDTSNVTNMYCMFQNCSSLTSLNLSSFDTTSVTNMKNMFIRCSSLTSLDLSNFDTSNVTNMSDMFDACSSLTTLDVSNFDTSNVTDMGGMFFNCSSLTSLNLSSFNTNNVTNMNIMFASCRSLTSLDLSNFDTTNVASMDNILASCSKLAQITFGEKWNKEIILPILTKICTGWYSDNNYTTKVAEAGANYIPVVPITIYADFICAPAIYVNLYDDGTLAFTSTDKILGEKIIRKSYGNIGGQQFNDYTQPWINERNNITSVDFIDIIQPISTSYWFSYCVSLLAVSNISNLDTSNVIDMNHMFYHCRILTNVDVTNFDTNNVTNMNSMFNNCRALTNIDLSNFDISNVTDMNSMFANIPTGCIILVKDQTTKDIILGTNSNLTNVMIKE